MPKKKAAAKKAEASAAPTVLPERQIEAVMLLMARGLDGPDLREVSIKAAGISEETVEAVIAEATKRRAVPSEFNLQEERSKSIIHWQDIYKLAHAQNDLTAAATARKNLDGLLKLHVPPHDEKPVSAAAVNVEAEAIRKHLVPLKLAPESAPLVEHCRIAALMLIPHLELN